jgi:hypothetical protein
VDSAAGVLADGGRGRTTSSTHPTGWPELGGAQLRAPYGRLPPSRGSAKSSTEVTIAGNVLPRFFVPF